MDATVNVEAREDAYSRPLDSIDVSVPELYQDDVYQPYFERLRREDPVHYCADSKFGPYWSVTRYRDIMKIAVNHQVFSSKWELGGVRLEDQVQGYERPRIRVFAGLDIDGGVHKVLLPPGPPGF